MNKQALIKLATLRLAINHVLRSRIMQKQAEVLTTYGKEIPSPSNSFIFKSDPFRGDYWNDPQYQEDMTKKYNFPYHVKPEYEYLRNIGSADYGSNINYVGQDDDSIHSYDLIDLAPTIRNAIHGRDFDYNVDMDDIQNPNYNHYFWDELAFRASLPEGTKGYVSPEKLQKHLNNFYDRYNGNRSTNVVIGYEDGKPVKKPVSIRSVSFRPEPDPTTPKTTIIHGFPFYPVTGINYDGLRQSPFQQEFNGYEQPNILEDMFKQDEYHQDFDFPGMNN